MDINDRLKEGAARIFSAASDQLMKAEPGKVGAVVFSVASPLICYAIGAETMYHMEVSKTMTPEAYSAFVQTLYPDSAMAFVASGLQGELATRGANLIVQSTAASALAGVTAGVATHLAKQFTAIKRILGQLTPEQKAEMAGASRQETDQPRGATSLSQEELKAVQEVRRESLHSQLARGLDALSENVKTPSSSASSRGPGM